MVKHGLAQQHAVLELLFGDATALGTRAVVARIFARLRIAAEVGMALGTEPLYVFLGKAISRIFLAICRG